VIDEALTEVASERCGVERGRMGNGKENDNENEERERWFHQRFS
jgi:hypothetical protein